MRWTKYLVLIGVALFLFILWQVGPLEVLNSLSGINLFVFSLALPVMAFSVLLKAWKQQVLVSAAGGSLSFWESTKIWMAGFFFGMVTPAKAGDFSRALYLRKAANLPLGKGAAAAAVERLLDLSFLLLAALAGLFLFSLHYSLPFSTLITLTAFFLLFFICVFFLTKKRWVSLILKPFFNLLFPARFKQRFRESFHSFYQGGREISANKKALALSIALTAFSWAVIIFQYYLVAFALSLSVSFLFFLWVMPAVILVEALPISFGGVGTRDATAIFLFSFASVSASQAVSLSLGILSLNLFLAVAGLFFVRWAEAKHDEACLE